MQYAMKRLYNRETEVIELSFWPLKLYYNIFKAKKVLCACIFLHLERYKKILSHYSNFKSVTECNSCDLFECKMHLMCNFWYHQQYLKGLLVWNEHCQILYSGINDLNFHSNKKLYLCLQH